jgi:single-strand DNA-binding protein
MGRLTRDPDIRYSQGAESTQVARYTLAVDRRTKKDSSNNQQTADFISCVAFGRAAKFAEDYLAKGTKLVVEGRIQTGSYTNRDGNRVYTTDVIVESQEFAESRAAGGAGSSGRQQDPPPQTDDDGFMHIPDGIDEELPFD